jgi:hypothetical protein
MGGVNVWLTDPKYQVILPPVDPDEAEWCQPAVQLLEYGRVLLGWAEVNPAPSTIAIALGRLDQRYRRLYDRTDDEHRLDERHATHPCLHRAFLQMAEQVEDLELLAPVTYLLPPILPEPVVIEGEVTEEPTLEDVRDVILGHVENDDVDNGAVGER